MATTTMTRASAHNGLMDHRLQAAAYESAEADDDLDAEGEEDDEMVEPVAAGNRQEDEADSDSLSEPADDEDADAEVESEEDDEEAAEESDDAVSAVALSSRSTRRGVTRKEHANANVSQEEESDADESGSDESSDEEEEVVEDDASADETGESIQVANRNNCVYCGQDEDHDPNPEFEENLACAACGDNAHRQCAREANTFSSDSDAAEWRCPGCVENGLQADSSTNSIEIEGQGPRARRQSSTSRFTRELLPNTRGLVRPGSHSVYNTLILNDDPLDGSRSLRKRKTSELPDLPEKRPRTQDSRASNPERSPERILAEQVETLNHHASRSIASTVGEARSTRSSRTPKSRNSVQREPPVTVTSRGRRTLELSLRIPPIKLKSILQSKRKRERPRPTISTIAEQPLQSHPTPFYAFHERENDDLKSKPYGGILSEAEAETTKTLPLQIDRLKFNKAREKAEEERRERAALSEAEQETKARAPKLPGPPSKIKCVFFGGHEIETWYAAPYPEEYSRNRTLYLCEYCLKYMSSDFVAWRHKSKCPAKHPPGDEIYRDGSISIFEVDGRKNPVYCQNLCLLAKLFLGSKTLYYDVEPFLFYVMTELDELGCHFVGYFSKEKRPGSLNNVSCILTLPTHQRKGYGNLLISFSYLLTRVEAKTGSPEKPLSDMGLVSYRNYWRLILSYELRNQIGPISVTELSNRTGMTPDDIIAALEGLRALVRDPVTKTYALRLDYEYFEKCITDWENKGYVTLNEDALVWTPYIMGRSNRAHYETAPPLATVAPREDEDEAPANPEEGVQQTLQQAAASAIGPHRGDENAIVDDTSPTEEAAQLASQLNIDPSLRQPQRDQPDVSTSTSPTKQTNGYAQDPTPSPEAPAIPPTRFEIFPPIPGLNPRLLKPKRGGYRPAGSGTGLRRNATHNTPSALRRRAKQLPLTPLAGMDTGKGSAWSSESSARRRTRAAVAQEKDGGTLDEARVDADDDHELPDAEADDRDHEGADEEEGDEAAIGTEIPQVDGAGEDDAEYEVDDEEEDREEGDEEAEDDVDEDAEADED